MSLPKPETQLGTHCSALFNGTLYAYSSTAFQSISLTSGAEWQTLPTNINTVGSECVHAHKNTAQEALYIVGGTTSNASAIPANGFMGLQRYLFNDNKWETIGLPVAVTYNLTNHGATFLETTQQIIVFSGTTWPDTQTPSANTYLIATAAPHEITSIPATDPLLAPLVLPWGDSAALIVGGDENNRGLRTFTPGSGWAALGMSLASGLPAKGKAGVSLMDGDDGSRMLYTFDLTIGPTAVTQLLVKEADAATRVRGRQETSAAASASALTASNWPSYNDTMAPTLTMDGVSVAYEGDMVVISPADDSSYPLAVFDARTNSWKNTTELFGVTSDENEKSISTFSANPSTSSTSTSPLPTGTSAESSAAAIAASSDSSGLSTVQILFIVLGVILGVIAALGIALVLIKRRRKQKNAKLGGARRMSFQDRGTSYMQEDPDSAPLPPRFPRPAIDSWASKDIEKPPFSRDGPIVTAIGGQGVISSNHASALPSGDPNMPARSSGWSKYFSGNELAMPQRSYAHSAHSSTYTDLSISFPTLKGAAPVREGQIHSNPFLRSPGVGVATSGLATPSSGVMSYHEASGSSSLQRSGSKGLMLQDPGVGVSSASGQRRASGESVSSMGASEYSSGVPESLVDNECNGPGGWSPVGGQGCDTRGEVVSSLYPDSPGLYPPGRATVTSSVYPDSPGLYPPAPAGRGPVASSLYPDSPGLQVRALAVNKAGDPQPGQDVDNLSWLNLRQ
ncbi:hypothetical protein P167DRAFT_571884 [Morchella conica CCBAS932]|uniref:Galactose oxidase n=1 Tax=Morchella conica CCBAS932 TaxID=1392247 RepID=A0A3N4L033_9PEZI|nr:hypothetical protein P167DRAFT_571884 [Morchella conica CCBAS932]